MDFDLNSERTVVERSGGSKAKIFVTAPPAAKVKFSATEWCTFLGEQMYGLSSLEAAGSKPPSFRSLFAYFVRRQASGAFMTPEKQATMQGTGDMQMALMFLLGLDWQIARDWQAVRDREKTLEELKKAAGNGAFGSIIGKVADLRTELTIQEARLKKLHAEVETFQGVAGIPGAGGRGRNAHPRARQDLANANTIDFSAIRNLENALASEIPPDHEDLSGCLSRGRYRASRLQLEPSYEDVKSFHDSVVRNRKDYLSSELEAAKLRIELRDSKKAQLDQRRGEILGILKSHGALEQFLKLQGELGRLESEVESLRQRFEAAEQLEGTKNELDIERNRLTIRLRRDFAEQKDRLAEAIVAFEETSQRLYESAGSMTVDEETSNGPIFKFPMQGERSKGIKNMQIFCFDMMLMRLCAPKTAGGTGWDF